MLKKEPELNVKAYYSVIIPIVLVMVGGLFLNNPQMEANNIKYIVQCAVFVVIAIMLFFFPFYKHDFLKTIIVVFSAIYFYLLFFLYPETGANFVLLCMIPAISLMFFEEKLVYFSLIINFVLMTMLISYILLANKRADYPFITDDLTGTITNFLGSQAILYFIYSIVLNRLEKIRVYYEEAKHAERLKTTGELAAAVAHEIRNPLTVVKGYLQFYTQDASFDQGKKKSFALLINELNSAEQVINELLSLAKPSIDTKLEKVDVKCVISSVTDLIQSYGLLNNNTIKVVAEDDLYISMNKMELNQVLVNIIKNAIEASYEGDSILISAKKHEDKVEIKVIDNGRGLTEEELENIGTPFYTLKNDGTGLGISICKDIVANYSGTIEYTSQKGMGTTVIISFPALND